MSEEVETALVAAEKRSRRRKRWASHRFQDYDGGGLDFRPGEEGGGYWINYFGQGPIWVDDAEFHELLKILLELGKPTPEVISTFTSWFEKKAFVGISENQLQEFLKAVLSLVNDKTRTGETVIQWLKAQTDLDVYHRTDHDYLKVDLRYGVPTPEAIQTVTNWLNNNTDLRIYDGKTTNGYTSHGHRIPFAAVVGTEKPKNVVRCGGPTLCLKCQQESAAWATENAGTDKVHKPVDTSDIFKNELRNLIADIDNTKRLGGNTTATSIKSRLLSILQTVEEKELRDRMTDG